MELYSGIQFNAKTDEEIIRASCSVLRTFENEFIEGDFLDIGCGFSSTLLDYVSWEREMYVIDKSKFELELLEKRVTSLIPSNKENWNYIHSEISETAIPKKEYSLIVLSNILHFFDPDSIKKIAHWVKQVTKNGSYIYLVVHSENHHCNNEEYLSKNDYFKTFFTKEDLIKLFPTNEFDYKYYAESEFDISAAEKKLLHQYFREAHLNAGYRPNTKEEKKMKREYIYSGNSIKMVLKKK